LARSYTDHLPISAIIIGGGVNAWEGPIVNRKVKLYGVIKIKIRYKLQSKWARLSKYHADSTRISHAGGRKSTE
jgi:hypothetical protein